MSGWQWRWSASADQTRLALGEPLAVFAATRAGLLLLSYFAEYLMPRAVGSGFYAGEPFLLRWARWDGQWYLRIAAEGYIVDHDGVWRSVAFFPLYPSLVRLVSQVTGDLLSAAWLVANVSMMLALVALYALTTRLCGREVARRTILLMSLAPFSLFFAAAYTESVFLLLAVLAFLLAERGYWWAAGLAGALCSATRLVGLALGPALLVLYLQRRQWRWRGSEAKGVAGPLLVALGTGLYALYLWLLAGEPLVFITASASLWERYSLLADGLPPLANLADRGGYYAYQWLNLLSGGTFLLLAIPVARLLGPAYALFVVICVLVPVYAGLDSLHRYTSVLFPGFIALAYLLRGRLAFTLLLVLFALGLGLSSLLFLNWYGLA